MALTGKLQADFSTFYDATKKAVVSLDGLDKAGKDVEKQLTKSAESFSGGKIIQQAQLAVEGLGRVGDATTLTEKEQAKLNALLNEAIAKYGALGKDAPAEMLALADATKQVAKPVADTSGFMGDLTTQLSATALGFLSAQAVIGGVEAAFKGLAEFVGSSIASYASAEAAAKKMTVALQNQGTATPANIAAMNDLATTMQRTTIYSDDLTNEMEALFIQIGNVGPSQMDAAMTAAANLATGLGIDLESAVTMVSKAAEGNVTTLGKYGVAIDAAKAKAEGLPAVLDAINARFGGQAQAAAETYAGKLHQLANEWDNLKEAVGRAVVEDPMLTALMTHMKEGITGVGEAAGDYTPTISDWWVKMSTNSTSLQLIVAYLNSIEAGMRAIGLETAGLRPPPPPQFKAPTDPFAGLWADAKANAEKLDETWKKQDEAATKHAEAIESMFRRISGADAAAQMRDLDTVFRRMAASGQITEAQVRAIAKEAEDLSNKGATLTPRLLDIVLATDQLSPGLNKASINFGELGTQVGIVAPKLDKVWETLNKPIPYGIGHLKDQFAALVVVSPETMLKGVQTKVIDTDKAIQNLSTSLANMAQVAPGAFGTVIGQVARLASTIDVARKAQDAYKEGKKAWDAGDSVAGIASMASGIAGIAQAAMMAVQGVKALISVFDRNKGRDAVVDFAQSFGGFDALHAQLLELGADGEKLWIKLTQGVGTNNPEQAARVIAEVEAALARQANATADVTVQTEEGAQATIETATAASAALDTVTAKLHDNAADWAVWSDAVMAAVNAAAGAVVQMPVPGPPSAVPGFASGTGGKYLNFGSGTLAMLHGRERVSVPGEGGGGGGTAIIQLNGRTLAEVVVPEMPGVITRYGLARG